MRSTGACLRESLADGHCLWAQLEHCSLHCSLEVASDVNISKATLGCHAAELIVIVVKDELVVPEPIASMNLDSFLQYLSWGVETAYQDVLALEMLHALWLLMRLGSQE